MLIYGLSEANKMKKLSKEERIRRGKEVYKSLGDLTSIGKIIERLKNFYFYSVVMENHKYRLYIQQCGQFLKSLALTVQGIEYHEIAKECLVSHATIGNWLRGQKPYLMLLAQSIPSEKPPKGKWLPLRMKIYAKPIDFILVPERIGNYNDIIFVLQQMNTRVPLKTKEKALGYIIGMLLSDLSKPKGYAISNQALLALTRRYEWNLKIGNSLCIYFKTLCINAKRIKDNTELRKRDPHGEFRWISEKTPFIRWLLHVCLALKKHEVTTFDKVKMGWILDAPMVFRKAFTQGLCDGDGSAHNYRRIEISCSPNQKFIVELLKTFKIKSRIDGDAVVIINNMSLLKAARIPIFKYAEGRTIKLNKIVQMIENPQKSGNGSDIRIRRKIIELKKQGYPAGVISEAIFDEFGIGVHPSSINKTFKTFIHPNEI